MLGLMPWSSSSSAEKLAVGGGGRMDHQGLHVGHVCQQGKRFPKLSIKLVGFLLTTLDFKGEDGAAAVGKILLIQSVVGMLGQGGMVHMLHLGMVCEELHDLLGVLCVAVQTKRQGLHTLQQQEGVEGRDGGAGIPQQEARM